MNSARPISPQTSKGGLFLVRDWDLNILHSLAECPDRRLRISLHHDVGQLAKVTVQYRYLVPRLLFTTLREREGKRQAGDYLGVLLTTDKAALTTMKPPFLWVAVRSS